MSFTHTAKDSNTNTVVWSCLNYLILRLEFGTTAYTIIQIR